MELSAWRRHLSVNTLGGSKLEKERKKEIARRKIIKAKGRVWSMSTLLKWRDADANEQEKSPAESLIPLSSFNAMLLPCRGRHSGKKKLILNVSESS